MRQMERSGIGVDYDDVLNLSSKWASDYGFELVTNINANSQRALQAALQDFYSGKLDYNGVVNNISGYFSPVRAEMIASTEISRGFSQGGELYEQQLRQMGYNTDIIWYTQEGACEICKPNHKQLKRRNGWTVAGVPAHPRCRCWEEVLILPK